MSDETPGAGQGALPPREGQGPRPLAERPATTMRLAHVVGGQYVLTTQAHGMPSLTQINPGTLPANTNLTQTGITRIISISPSRVTQTNPLRPSLANQSIVNVLTKPRTNANVRLQLFSGDNATQNAQHPVHQRPVKRPADRKDYAAKLQHVMNHRIVRSKLVKEKYNEHLLEAYHLETGNNILDLYQYAKRPKTQAHLAYLREHAVDPQEAVPSATSASSLPGISTSTPTVDRVKTKTPAPSSQDLIVEKAKQEAYVVQRVAELQKEGLWSEKRLPKVQEMHRAKAHWDFLLEEMVWLAADFAQERKWKKAAAKKCARMVQKHFQDKALAAQKAERALEQNLRRIAGFCAKEVKLFWGNVEKLVEFKQNTILEEKRKRALDQQLSFIVDQTEKYSQLLAEGMNKTTRGHPDVEFHPDLHTDDEDDDEETIEQEEAAAAGDSAGHLEEVEALRKESQMELDDLLEDDLLRDYLLNRDKIRLSESEESDGGMKGGSSEAEDSDSTEEEEESEEEAQKPADELKLLVEDSHKEGDGKKTEEDDKDRIIDDAAAIAESIQPKGNTLSSTNVSTNIPFLLKYSLREYQHIGLDWLVTMYERKLNGILADEMGLGKTIQTIALLAHLACEKGDWGPHLIVVPTSVMLNWEMECKKWCPAFKILTYYGSQKERKLKRTGWTKPNAFHICITSYKLVIQDHQSFRRKKWKYLILDEAQNIKNFKSQRWQLLLNFQTQQRLLLTGTPLQNNLMELWSLMHFLMPNVFQSHREFKEWFSNPVTGMIEGNSEYNENIIKRLHKVLRPFLLRRLKSEVEKQMPKKYEHVVVCRLSKRQRYLYDDYMSRAKTRETLASGNMLSVINVLMQLRKVCNHPNLFEVRPTISPFQCEGISLHIPSIVYSALDYDPDKHVNFEALNLLLIMQEIHFSSYQCYRMRQSRHSRKIIELDRGAPERPPCPPCKLSMRVLPIKGAAATAGRPNVEKKEVAVAQPPPLQLKGLAPQNVKVKVAGMQLLNQQGVLKTIPVVNISQGATSQIGTPVNVTSLLKPADKISASFAQLVQTSTGKHLLLTSNPNITANIPVTSTTGGQKLTFLSKQPVSTIGSTGHAVTKAFVKFQLSSVTTATTVSTVTTNSGTVSVVKSDDKLKASRAQIGNDYIGRLYSKQNSLDVRWQNEDKAVGVPNEEDPKGERRNRLMLMASINKRRCSALPLYGRDFQDAVKIFSPNKIDPWQGGTIHCLNTLYNKTVVETTSCLSDMLYSPERRIETLKDICDRFIFCVPAVRSAEPALRVCHPPPSRLWGEHERRRRLRRLFSRPATALHRLASATVTQFPDPRLIQYDCGKLQTLDGLLRSLRSGGHRALIFTQMTRMLDVLEAFLNFHGHIYLRLDGTTKVDQRQVLMERFNGDKRIFAFILSTRSGGVGVNLTGADTVIFYDSDWNPTMDAQAQDRCHRIGQTRDVHIYRLVSERTIEENILKKANQKRLLGDLAIEGGNFTTAFFKSSTIQDLFDVDQKEDASSEAFETKTTKEALASAGDEKSAMGALESALAACEDDQDVQAAKTAKAEAVADLAEFDENIPLDEHEAREPEVSKAEAEINNIIEKLSPIEKYAMKFIEATESAWSAEQLAAAEREIEQQKRDWERDRLAAMREEEERRARDLEDDVDLLTFSREDAANQVSVGRATKRLHRGSRGGRRAALGRSRRRPKPPDGGAESEEDGLSSGSEVCRRGIDRNSPRTRSRGTVAINLWTLDVSPILPGEKPVPKRRKSVSEEESDRSREGSPKITTKKKRLVKRKSNSCVETPEGQNQTKTLLDKGKICKVLLNDIVAEGQYRIPAEVDKEMEVAEKEETASDRLDLDDVPRNVELEDRLSSDDEFSEESPIAEDLTDVSGNVEMKEDETEEVIDDEPEKEGVGEELPLANVVPEDVLKVDEIEVSIVESSINDAITEEDAPGEISERNSGNIDAERDVSVDKSDVADGKTDNQERELGIDDSANLKDVPGDVSDSAASDEAPKNSDSDDGLGKNIPIDESEIVDGKDGSREDNTGIDDSTAGPEKPPTSLENTPRNSLEETPGSTDFEDRLAVNIPVDGSEVVDGKDDGREGGTGIGDPDEHATNLKNAPSDVSEKTLEGTDLEDGLNENIPVEEPEVVDNQQEEIETNDSITGADRSNKIPEDRSENIRNSSSDEAIPAEPKNNSHQAGDDIDIPAKKVEDNAGHRDNGLGEFQKITTIVNNRTDNFRSPESRKRGYRFNKFSNNMTLDGWVTKTPLKKRNNDVAGFGGTSKSLHSPP